MKLEIDTKENCASTCRGFLGNVAIPIVRYRAGTTYHGIKNGSVDQSRWGIYDTYVAGATDLGGVCHACVLYPKSKKGLAL